MESAHGICVLRAGREGDDGASVRDFVRFKADQARDGNFVRVRFCHESSLRMGKSVTRIKKAQVRPDWMLGNSLSTPKTERAAELTAGAWEIEKNVTGVQGNVSNVGDLDRLFAQIMRE